MSEREYEDWLQQHDSLDDQERARAERLSEALEDWS